MIAALWAILGVCAGAFIAVQAPINAELARGLGMPVAAAAASFLTGAVALAALSFVFSAAQGVTIGWRVPAPWLFVAGGLLGAAYVTSVIILTPKLGAAATMALIVAGQLIAGMLLDRIGFMGMAVREITAGRMIGVLLLLSGALMIRLT